jgi:hypothetical protein
MPRMMPVDEKEVEKQDILTIHPLILHFYREDIII